MKEVIRLTESDITRIVRRVIKEQSSEVVKVRGWDTVDGMTKQDVSGYNLDISNLHLVNRTLNFNYTIPGTTSKGTGLTSCGNKNSGNNIVLTINNKVHQLYLTPVGYKKITKLCDSYASNGTKTNGDYV
jgi:hypothetical protein